MQQLSGLDAAFVFIESATTPMHIARLAIYDPSTATGGRLNVEQIAENVHARAAQIPVLCNTLQTVPLDLDRPYWRCGETFDTGYHIRHLSLKAPGNWQQLCDLVAELHASPLDFERPLWEMYMIEGLDSVKAYPRGCFAVLTKVHHSAVDGAAFNELTLALHDASPQWKRRAKASHTRPEAPTSALKLLTQARLNTLEQPVRAARVAAQLAPGVARLATGLLSGKLHRAPALPITRFNRKVCADRVFGAERFDFASIQTIKGSVTGATVNDVALAIVGGALNKYLRAKDELPDQSMAAAVPINIRVKGERTTGGNQVSQMAVRVASQIARPQARLLAVVEASVEAKEMINTIGAKTLTDMVQLTPSMLAAPASRLASKFGIADHTRPVYNCTVTNLPGPAERLYFTGAKMLANIGSGPLTDGNGLFHAITSYCGDLAISFLSCQKMMPDPEFYGQCLRESYEDFLEEPPE